MNLLEAVAKWYGCPYGLKTCKNDCENYMYIDPRTYDSKGEGPTIKGQRTLCNLLNDMDAQILEKTKDTRFDAD